MAKVKVTYVGVPGDDTQVIEAYGQSFTKGEAVSLDDTHPQIEKFRGNPSFAVDNEPVELPDNPEEVAAVKKELDARGITYTTNASLASLRSKLAKATVE